MAISRKIYILVLNWNNWKDTVECLESVFQNRYPHFQVLCIDNGSTDDSEQKINDWARGELVVSSKLVEFNANNKPVPVVTYDRRTAEEGGDSETERECYPAEPLVFIKAERNAGYAGGNNIGMRYVLKKNDGEFLWILNNDTVVDKSALLTLASKVEKNPSAGMVGSKLLYYDNPSVLEAAGGCKISLWLGKTTKCGNSHEDVEQWDDAIDVDFICGASLLVRRNVIEDIGLMDESYFLYWEDADWGVRARKKHYELVYCPTSVVWHKVGGTSGRVTSLNDYYWTRNGLLFTKKLHPAFLVLTPLSYLIKHTVVRLMRRQPLHLSAFIMGVVDFIRGRTGKRK